MTSKPKSRSVGVSAEWVNDELVVYDEASLMAHCLSSDAAHVFELCDGERSEAEITLELGLDADTVQRAMEQLTASSLLESDSGYSRREAAKHFAKVGGAAFVAPLIYSVAIPGAAAALSCAAGTTPCGTPTNACCSSAQKCCAGTCITCAAGKSCPGIACAGGGNCCSGTCTAGFCA